MDLNSILDAYTIPEEMWNLSILELTELLPNNPHSVAAWLSIHEKFKNRCTLAYKFSMDINAMKMADMMCSSSQEHGYTVLSCMLTSDFVKLQAATSAIVRRDMTLFMPKKAYDQSMSLLSDAHDYIISHMIDD